MVLKWYTAWSSIEEVPYCFSRSCVKFQGHTGQKKIHWFWKKNWAFPDCKSSFNPLMAMKWCTNLEATWERCPIVFQGHLLNFKVLRDKRSPILIQIERSQTVTPIWIHLWLWNDAQSLMCYIRGALSFSKVIRQISKSHRKKIANFDPNWASQITGVLIICSTVCSGANQRKHQSSVPRAFSRRTH